MKKTYAIEVDCANCANEMQAAAAQVAGVKTVVVNFMLQKMIVEFEPDVDQKAVMAAVRNACKRVEPDCEVAL